MCNIFLHKYKGAEELISAYNAPHKYRVITSLLAENNKHSAIDKKRLKTSKKNAEEVFKQGLAQLSDELCVALNKEGYDKIDFVFATPETKRENKLFVSELEYIITQKYPNSINISKCFKQECSLNATKKQKRIADQDLANCYCFDDKTFTSMTLNKSIENLVLLDDVYSNGNTFRAMELSLLDKMTTLKIIKVAILKT